jgi:antitoxin (DNA-binding transcriptional repressor) of toxin-antitoxin stability system
MVGFAMREIGAFEAKNTFGNLLDLVEQGEEIVITRRGKPVARMIRETLEIDPAPAREAMKRIHERARTAGTGGFDWQEWKAYRDEGRR